MKQTIPEVVFNSCNYKVKEESEPMCHVNIISKIIIKKYSCSPDGISHTLLSDYAMTTVSNMSKTK